MSTTEIRRAIALIRHGESIKNIEDRHGGIGASLTAKGREEIAFCINYINQINSKSKCVVYYSNKPQLRESAEIIANSLSADLIVDSRIRPLYLGVLDGLSREEALNLHPETAILMERWRKGEIEISGLKIPNAENLQQFWNRGMEFIMDITQKDFIHIIVGTRSILTLLISILLERTIQVGGGYKYIEIPTGGILTFVYKTERRHYELETNFSNFKI
ncbi:MAG: histidine phosphatase family protein [candidate division WOR-3 bacterium]